MNGIPQKNTLRLLAEADTLQKAKELKDLALTAADWARRKDMGEEAILHCRSYALDAERRMGELLRESVRDRGRPTRRETEKPTTLVGFSNALTLKELGVSENQSSRALLATASTPFPRVGPIRPDRPGEYEPLPRFYWIFQFWGAC